MLPTDTQKNTVFAFAKEKGVGAIEEFALTLAEHLVASTPVADGARVEVERVRPGSGSRSTARATTTRSSSSGSGTRTTVVNVDGGEAAAHVVSGICDLVVLKSTGSEFRGFLKDRVHHPRRRPTTGSSPRRWWPVGATTTPTSTGTRRTTRSARCCCRQFAAIHSLALQQTLYGMGQAVLESHPEVAEIRFSAPNKHHFLVDLTPFGVENPNEVFFAADRPYGLIEATVLRDDASDAGSAWHAMPGWV